MRHTPRLLSDAVIAVAAISLVIYSTMLLAGAVISSPVYRQSRILSMLLEQDSLDISEMLEDTRNIELVINFTGALAAAYINFEMIPVGESATLVAVFESMNGNVDIENFEYRRKDLAISGSAAAKADFEAFLESLSKREHFAHVEGGCYDSTGGGVKFEILCAAR